MSVLHGGYIHVDLPGGSYRDPACPSCKDEEIARLQRECEMRQQDHMAACGKVDAVTSVFAAESAHLRKALIRIATKAKTVEEAKGIASRCLARPPKESKR